LRQRGTEATMLLVLNGHFDLVEFTLPPAPGGNTWTRLIDTNVPDDPETPSFKTGESYGVTARSLLLFALSE
jgi:glycogen operon protein